MRPLHALGIFLAVSALNGAVLALLTMADTRTDWTMLVGVLAFASFTVAGALWSTGRVTWRGALDRVAPTVGVVLGGTTLVALLVGAILALVDASWDDAPVWVGYALLVPSALVPVVGFGLDTWKRDRLASLAYRPAAVAAALLGFALGVVVTHMGTASLDRLTSDPATHGLFTTPSIVLLVGTLLTLPWFLSAWAHHKAMGPTAQPPVHP